MTYDEHAALERAFEILQKARIGLSTYSPAWRMLANASNYLSENARARFNKEQP